MPESIQPESILPECVLPEYTHIVINRPMLREVVSDRPRTQHVKRGVKKIKDGFSFDVYEQISQLKENIRISEVPNFPRWLQNFDQWKRVYVAQIMAMICGDEAADRIVKAYRTTIDDLCIEKMVANLESDVEGREPTDPISLSAIEVVRHLDMLQGHLNEINEKAFSFLLGCTWDEAVDFDGVETEDEDTGYALQHGRCRVSVDELKEFNPGATEDVDFDFCCWWTAERHGIVAGTIESFNAEVIFPKEDVCVEDLFFKKLPDSWQRQS